MEQHKPYMGGCACGRVRYEVAAEPAAMAFCQCRQCQQGSSTGHGTPERFQPQMVMWTKAGHAWDTTGAYLRRFEKLPPRE